MLGTELEKYCLHFFLVFSIVQSKVVSDNKDNTKDDIFEDTSNGYQFKLQAPISYNMEDLLMTLAVLIILFIMIMIWYGLARTLIYLAYHTEQSRITDQEERIYEEDFLKHGVSL